MQVISADQVMGRRERSWHVFERDEWARLRADVPLVLSDRELARLRGRNDRVSLTDVAEIYLPLSRLLNLRITAARGLYGTVENAFLGRPARPAPYVIGVAGSVAVGKSTFARVLQAVLARWPDHPRVELVTTDGFLLPRTELERRGLMGRKGFPESYDLRRMLQFLAGLKSGLRDLAVPVYSHETYDIVPHHFQRVDQPDILIFEGLNVLQAVSNAPVVSSDFFDFSIYLDAGTEAIQRWYVERFLLLQRTVFQDPSSYFHHYRDLDPDRAQEVATGIWDAINLPNLLHNILPTRERARLILRKGADHAVEQVRLRRF